MHRATFPTAIGTCGICWNSAGLTRFMLPEAEVEANDTTSIPADIAALIGRVQRHLLGDPQDFDDLQYDFDCVSSFQRAVYEAALKVKSGHTGTYGGLARALGQPPAVSRAVGTALGQNPWPLLVPCHRFISADGKMTGFSGPGGIKTKLRLLALEGSELFSE